MSHNRPQPGYQTGQSRNMNSKSNGKSGRTPNHNPSRKPQSHGSTINGTTTTTIAPVGGGGGGSRGKLNPEDEQKDAWIKARQIRQQQLLTEHFGFSPLSFVDDVINSVNNMIYQASMALQEYIESQMDEMIVNHELPDGYDVKIESGKSMHQFETLLEASVDKNFDRFELYALKNLFGVPEDVDIVLPHYESLDFNIKVEREQHLDEQLEILRRKVIATKALNYRLRKELEVEENRRRQLKKCHEQIQFLKDAVNEYSDVTPIPQTLIFVRDNIQTLHRRFQSLHEKLQQNANKVNSANNSLIQTTAHNSQSTFNYQPTDSVTLALHEALLNVEPDQRSIYIRSVVRRQIEEQLQLDSINGGNNQRFPTT